MKLTEREKLEREYKQLNSDNIISTIVWIVALLGIVFIPIFGQEYATKIASKFSIEAVKIINQWVGKALASVELLLVIMLLSVFEDLKEINSRLRELRKKLKR